MNASRRFFPKIMLENEKNYLALIEGVVNSVDEYACVEITKVPDAYLFRIVASLPKYNETLLEEILRFNNLFGIRLILSKSIKSSSIITFRIKLI